jgi:hypothetical protein
MTGFALQPGANPRIRRHSGPEFHNPAIEGPMTPGFIISTFARPVPGSPEIPVFPARKKRTLFQPEGEREYYHVAVMPLR